MCNDFVGLVGPQVPAQRRFEFESIVFALPNERGELIVGHCARAQTGGDLGGRPVADFIAAALDEIGSKAQAPAPAGIPDPTT